jgi:segregation and condensation protein A
MEAARNYEINLEIFQGPLDLLLFLIKKKKINIHDIPIAIITREYLEYLEEKKKINLEREAEFLLMAALLIHIKSQMLLPREEILQEEDPRRPLVNRLLEFQRIKAAGQILKEKEKEQLQIRQRTFLPPLAPQEDEELTEVSLFELAEVFYELIKKKELEGTHVIQGKETSIEEKMKEIMDHLKENMFLDFLEYFRHQETLEEALISFFCLLELIRARIVIAIQESLFHTIKVWLREENQS